MGLLRVALAFLIAGCVGEIPQTGGDGTGSSDSPKTEYAKQIFAEKAFPVFNTICAACHAGSYPEVTYLRKAPGDALTPALMRRAVLDFKDASNNAVVDLTDTAKSMLLLKGSHDGTPALSGADALSLSEWLDAEKDAQDGTTTTTLQTDKVDVLTCDSGVAGDPSCPINRITLDHLGLPGAEIDFLAQAVGGSLYLTDLYVKASNDGAYIEHPLFASWPQTGDAVVDTVDRFSAVKLNLATSATAAACPGPSCEHIGVGEALFVGFPANDKLSISFHVVDKYKPDTTTPTTVIGCGTGGLASFNTNVKPLFTPICVSCHAGTANAGARNAMDLSALATATDNTACLQVYSHLSFTTGVTSGLILAPTPGQDAAHPAAGKLSGTTNPTLAAFTSGVNTWQAIEAAARP